MYLKAISLFFSLTLLSAPAVAGPRRRPSRGFERYRNTTSAERLSAAAYTFVPDSSSNLAVYYGKTAISMQTNLTAQCSDENIDIVILAFLLNILGPGNLPTMALNNTAGELCNPPSTAMLAAGGTGLKVCDDLQSQIQTCQGLGKKVFISLGGQSGTQTFASEAEAKAAAGVLWNLFGSGTGLNSDLRPFGETVTLDGFDIDNETGNGSYYPEFASELRRLTKTQSLKKYYLSAAPACYYPTASSPITMLTQMDFVWPQFYGSPSCNIGTSGLATSLSGWSSRLDTGDKPRLYLGGVAWSNGTTNGGYVDPQTLNQTILSSVHSVGTKKFGGVMLWDAANGQETLDPETGLDIIAVAKDSLLISAGCVTESCDVLLRAVTTVIALKLLI